MSFGMHTLRTKKIAKISFWCTLLVVYICATVRHFSIITPAAESETYWDLKSQGVPLERAVRVLKPTNHVCVFGEENAGWWTIPSGPPAYLFNEAGKLVDCTCDVGDSWTFQNDYQIYSGIEVDMATLESLFAARRITVADSGP
jgi:hypothetical protein